LEPQEYDTIIRHLAAAIAQQETINARMLPTSESGHDA
jgi:hypothetical protein